MVKCNDRLLGIRNHRSQAAGPSSAGRSGRSFRPAQLRRSWLRLGRCLRHPLPPLYRRWMRPQRARSIAFAASDLLSGRPAPPPSLAVSCHLPPVRGHPASSPLSCFLPVLAHPSTRSINLHQHAHAWRRRGGRWASPCDGACDVDQLLHRPLSERPSATAPRPQTLTAMLPVVLVSDGTFRRCREAAVLPALRRGLALALGLPVRGNCTAALRQLLRRR